MPNIKQQVKRMRKSEDQRQRNRSTKSALKTRIKKFEGALEAGEKETAAAEFKLVARDLDKAASKGVIHKNKAANKKSRMARSLAGLR
jgi:small subunit ribosomal protein S20